MRSVPRPTARLLAPVLASALVLSATPTAPAAQAARAPATPVVLALGSMPVGDAVAVPHVEGTSIVDGDTRIPVPDAERVELLGRTGSAYVAAAFDAQGRQQVVRATASGTLTTLVTPSRQGDVVILSDDGTRLAQSSPIRRFTASRIRVWDAGTGERVAGKAFRGLTSVLDLDASRVVLAQDRDSSTRSWATGSGEVSLVVKRAGYRVDLAADRLASFDADPYDGGCTVVSRLSEPQARLWRSCSERVETFSPRARRMATVDLLSDGIGPSQVLVRGSGGASKGVYRVRGYFGPLTWESGKALLLETSQRKRTATVRCIDGACERASGTSPTPDYRRSAPARPLAWG